MMNKGKIIIFGATGKVGCYTSLYLKEMGYDIVAVGRRSSDNGFFADYDIPYVSVDIMDKEQFEKLPKENVFGVIDMAGILPAVMKGFDPRKYIMINEIGTLNVLDYSISSGVKRFVYPQTYSDLLYLCNGEKPVDADATRSFPKNNDHSIYAITKNAACDLVMHYSFKYGFKYFILRLQNIFCYHPNPSYFIDGKKKMTGQRAIIEQAERGEDIELWGNPECKRDVVYVKDCVQIIEKALSSEAPSGFYNVGNGMPVSRLDQIKGIIEVFGDPSKSKIIINRSKPDSPNFQLDITKTVENLGFKPKYDYISFLEDLKEEMINNRFEKLWGKESDYTDGIEK
jgi:UDP-glucose 4-epimerase